MRKIIHLDMDCFFAAIEVRDHPHLAGKPVAVGGSAQKRGVLSTANYMARKYGVRSAMPTSLALRKCPDLILMPSRFNIYKMVSAQIREIFYSYTDRIEPLSLDEAFLDVTQIANSQEEAIQIASEIRKKILMETSLESSAGIATNKFLAKIASDWKKPNGQFAISPQKIDDFIFNLPIKKIPGVGKVTSEKIHSLNITKCGELQKLSMQELKSLLGKYGEKLYDYCRGIDNRPVATSKERKSISVENTYSHDLKSLEECLEKTEALFQELTYRCQKKSYSPQSFKGVFVKVKYFDFKVNTISSSEKNFSIDSYRELVQKIFLKNQKPVRLLGLGIQLKSFKDDPVQLTFSFLQDSISEKVL